MAEPKRALGPGASGDLDNPEVVPEIDEKTGERKVRKAAAKKTAAKETDK